MKTVTLTMQDQQTLHVISRTSEGRFTAAEAAEVLGLSIRQVRRKVRAYRKRGAASIPHQNRGRRPHNALSPALTHQVRELMEQYKDYNNHHLQETLAEEHGLHLSVSSLRRLRIEAGQRSPRKRRPPKHRRRRQPKPQAGMMLQLDASPHPWLGEARTPFSLLAAIDDATNEVFALFREQEDTVGYMELLRTVIRQRGVPLSLYADRHTIFRSPKSDRLTVEEQLAGKQPDTQFQRASRELGIQIIAAHSPQAKGRIENLMGTLQDRLVAELKHAQITTLEEAQQFLTGFLRRYNQRFRRPPADPNPAWRPAPSGRPQPGRQPPQLHQRLQ